MDRGVSNRFTLRVIFNYRGRRSILKEPVGGERFDLEERFNANLVFFILLLQYLNMSKKIQKISTYFAVFESAEEGGYNVSFPDFPGCVTFGKDFEEAKEMAKDVLELWLKELASQKQKIPVRVSRPIIDEIKIKHGLK